MALNAARAVLIPSKTALLVCDMQEKFTKIIFEFNKIVKHSTKLIESCNILHIPIIVTEQNPKGLGKTISELNISKAKASFPKTQFSMYIPEVHKELESICNNKPPTSIILIGIECHICIENTAIDLKKNNFEVHIVADCCSSRTEEDKLLALERMRQIGCFIATSENIIFKLVGDSKHKDFNQIQNLIKTANIE